MEVWYRILQIIYGIRIQLQNILEIVTHKGNFVLASRYGNIFGNNKLIDIFKLKIYLFIYENNNLFNINK